jgi:hypothetical protein
MTRQSSSRVNSRTIKEPGALRLSSVHGANCLAVDSRATHTDLTASLGETFEGSLHAGKNLEEIPRRLDRG